MTKNYPKGYTKENKYRKNITFLDDKGNKKYSVILRFKDKKDADSYTNRMSNVRVKDLGYASSSKRKVVRRNQGYNPFGSFKMPKF